MHKRFKKLLHDYKVDIFHQQHSPQDLASLTSECMHLTEEVLNQKYQYHFHKLPDADRAEIINMINNYVREAILPPVVEKIMRRVTVLEHQNQEMVQLLDELMEALSE